MAVPSWMLICNSHKMGVCGYECSRIYQDQFELDKE